jgi:hypothetical protein
MIIFEGITSYVVFEKSFSLGQKENVLIRLKYWEITTQNIERN